MELQGKQCKLILDVYWHLENGNANNEEIKEAYECLPTKFEGLEVGIKVMSAAIRRYVIFHLEDLEYCVGNSDIPIDELLEEIELKTLEQVMPTTLINEQSQPQADAKEVETYTDIPKPKKETSKPRSKRTPKHRKQ